MENALYGPHLQTKEDIPGNSLTGRKPSALKNAELKFWLRCRGDSCNGLGLSYGPGTSTVKNTVE